MHIPRNRLFGTATFSRVKLSGPKAYRLHDHEFGEIFCLDKGSFRHHVNGKDFTLTTGTLVLIRPWDCHSFHGVTHRPFYLNLVCFDWRIFQYLRQRYFPDQETLYGEAEDFPRMISLNEYQLKRVRSLFLSHFSKCSDRFTIERFLLNLFAEFYAPQTSSNISASTLPDWMAEAWRRIHEPEYFRLGVNEFCRLSGRSREHTSRVFHKITGLTLEQAIRQLRMDHAALLLEASSLEIIDIALECGFQSLSHFYVCFQKTYQTSPLAYRRRAQGKMYES